MRIRKLFKDILTRSDGRYCINKTAYFVACIIFCSVVVVELIRGDVRYDIMLLFMATVGGIGMVNKGIDAFSYKKTTLNDIHKADLYR